MEEIRASLPEMPESRKERYITQYGLPEYDAGILTSSIKLANFFESALEKTSNAKAVSNWIMGDLMRILKDKEMEADEIPFPAEYLAELVNLIDEGTISGTIAKKVFAKMFDTGKAPGTIVKEEGLEVVSDEGAIVEAVKKVIVANPQSVADYKGGKEKAIGFLVGQVMRETKGKANPQIVNKVLREELNKI